MSLESKARRFVAVDAKLNAIDAVHTANTQRDDVIGRIRAVGSGAVLLARAVQHELVSETFALSVAPHEGQLQSFLRLDQAREVLGLIPGIEKPAITTK